MIAVKLEGRLGNQLFQYAFIYATAKKLGTSFYIDKSIENFIPGKYFTVKQDYFAPLDRFVFSIMGYKNFFSFYAKRAFYRNLEYLLFRHKKTVIDNKEHPSDALNKIKNRCMYEGYFQSEKYFEAFKDDIKKVFTLKKKYIDAFNDIATGISADKKKIVVHIRRTDYVGLEVSLPLAYYKKALDAVNHEEAICIFVSDDQQYIEKHFSYVDNKYVSCNSEIIDLQFLMNADVCILSNSSFSWWGAWLNNNVNKQVIAPNNWLGYKKGYEYPNGVSLPEWILYNAE